MRKPMTVPAASKIDWASRPKALVIRFAFYIGDELSKNEYLTLKIVFKRGLRRAPIERTYDLNDKSLKVKSVKSYEILEDESSEHHSNYFHIISALDNNFFFDHPSELQVYTPDEFSNMYYQVIRQVEE
jgi:hypothetical protein